MSQIRSNIVQHNDKVINMFWRDWKHAKRLEIKAQKRKLFIKKIKTSKRFKIRQRNKK